MISPFQRRALLGAIVVLCALALASADSAPFQLLCRFTAACIAFLVNQLGIATTSNVLDSANYVVKHVNSCKSFMISSQNDGLRGMLLFIFFSAILLQSANWRGSKTPVGFFFWISAGAILFFSVNILRLTALISLRFSGRNSSYLSFWQDHSGWMLYALLLAGMFFFALRNKKDANLQ